MKKKLIRNMARCRKCGDVIESIHVHDWKQCSCGAIFVDGGLEYSRCGFDKIENFENMCEWEEVEE